ncbi:hypothetical protein OIU77_030230 [Salix suchowensis]|uniref:Uncharacterized protein n=2 Tax=Salix TaxID=40685 RepID=A0A9Q0VG40_9ROSI|nr:hypothetical protein OIU78_003099 [Salix suchowensis]KAJ6381507.1 hypothetical protein OIU77_030230 [Salix suchowensis]KAJ6746920.1 hypothetical protein OIU74_029397 [Salix koriyanagi]
MEVKKKQNLSEDEEVEELAMVQTNICLLSQVCSFEACFKLKTQDQRKQSRAYESVQGHGKLWRVYRLTSDVENGSSLSSNCSKH